MKSLDEDQAERKYCYFRRSIEAVMQKTEHGFLCPGSKKNVHDKTCTFAFMSMLNVLISHLVNS